MPSKVIVYGGAGNLGTLVTKALLEKGNNVVVLDRYADKFDTSSVSEVHRKNLQLVTYYFGYPKSEAEYRSAGLPQHFVGASTVVSCANPTFFCRSITKKHCTYDGQKWVAEQCAKNGAHMVVISSNGLHYPNSGIAMFLNTVAGNALGWHAEFETWIRSSKVDYTMIRAPMLTDEDKVNPLHLFQGDLTDGQLSRRSLCDMVLKVMDKKSYWCTPTKGHISGQRGEA